MAKNKTSVDHLNKIMVWGLLVSTLSGQVIASENCESKDMDLDKISEKVIEENKSLKSMSFPDSQLSLVLPDDSEYKSIYSQDMLNRSSKELNFTGCYEVLSLDKDGESIDLSRYSDRLLEIVDGSGSFSPMWEWYKIPEEGRIEPISVVNISKPPIGEYQSVSSANGLGDGSGTERRQAVVRKIENGFQVFHRGDVYGSWSYHYDFAFHFNTVTEITVDVDTLNIKWIYLKEVRDTTDPKYDKYGFLYYPSKNKLMKTEKLTLKKLQTSVCK